jgi:DNA-binding SARP family transcriptional activator
MAEMKVTLFGKFNIQRQGLRVDGMEARKVQELLVFLLLFRNHPQSRELLCEALWPDQSSANSRKQLRQTLWRLQSAIQEPNDSADWLLRIDNDSIEINIADNTWLDIEEFEKIFRHTKGKKATELTVYDFQLLEGAVELYKGDLLEGWYTDWCIAERERFQTMHLLLLDKLVQYCELHENYEAGLSYGMEILRHDRAYERAHRQIMHLYFMTGNRTQAIQQYKRCVQALREELGVEPSEVTKLIYQQICADQYAPDLLEENVEARIDDHSTPALRDVLYRLKEVSEALSRIEREVQSEIGLRGHLAPG